MNALAYNILIPLIGAWLIVMLRHRPKLRDSVLVIVGLVNLLVLTVTASRVAYFDTQIIFSILPKLNIAFHLEPLGLIFAFTASVLWPITSIYAIGYLNKSGDRHQTRFHSLFCVAIASTLGIAFAENLFTLFLFYEILTFATWPLVTHNRTPDALTAGRKYLGVLLFTSLLFLLFAIVLVSNYGDSLSFSRGGVLANVPIAISAAILVLFVFGIGKAALMPFHRWLPNAMVAPAPVSALLHAVAVVKAGVFSILKISVYIFGIDTLNAIELRDILLWVPAITILLASAIAMRQDDIKACLAYSTISQLSYIVLAALLASQSAIIGGALHIPAHALAKITLFFCAGAIMLLAGKKKVSELNGMGSKMPWTFAAFFIASLSLAGLPPASGMWSKITIALGALQTDHLIIVGILMLSSLLNLYYLTAIPVRAFFLKQSNSDTTTAETDDDNIERQNPLIIIPLLITAIASVVLFFFADNLVSLVETIMGAIR